MENIVLRYDNIIGPKFIQVCLKMKLKLGVYTTQFYLSLNAVKILKKYFSSKILYNICMEIYGGKETEQYQNNEKNIVY